MKKSSIVLVCLVIAACFHEGDDAVIIIDSGPYELTFILDKSFQVPHGNQPIRIALVDLTNGFVVEEDFGIVSATDNPSYLFAPTAEIERGSPYAVRYWIDSNINGGTQGICDPVVYDHQWSVEFFNPTNDINFITSYQPQFVEYVCDTFL